MLHGTGIFTYIWLKLMIVNAVKYSSPFWSIWVWTLLRISWWFLVPGSLCPSSCFMSPGCQSPRWDHVMIKKGLEDPNRPNWPNKIHKIHPDLSKRYLFIWVFPKIVGKPPKWMVKIMENPIKMDDLGGKPTIFGNIHLDGTWLVLFKDVYFHPEIWGRCSPILTTIFSDGLVKNHQPV